MPPPALTVVMTATATTLMATPFCVTYGVRVKNVRAASRKPDRYFATRMITEG